MPYMHYILQKHGRLFGYFVYKFNLFIFHKPAHWIALSHFNSGKVVYAAVVCP